MDIWEKATIIFFMLLMVPLSWILSFSIYNNQVLNKNLNTASISDSEVFNKKEIVELNNNIKESNQLLNPPEIVNAVYVTSWSASSKKYVDEYLPKLFKNTEINAVVIDIKDYSGFISYETNSNYAIKYKTFKRIIPDLKELINKLHLQGVYTIARITVFEDPAFAQARPDLAIYDTLKTTDKKNPVLWQDSAGLNWLDPSSLEVWDYNISIAKDAVLNGFDEINFDYIRFPSDGKIENMGFPIYNYKTQKQVVIKEFFKKIKTELPEVKISGDLFGQTTTSFNDMGIGQVIENSFSFFDYTCPMLYPSHYGVGFLGFKNPATHPYEIVFYSLVKALKKEVKFLQTADALSLKKSPRIRPWLQDFNLGAVYTDQMVKDQIKAAKDVLGDNYSGYMLWNPSNIYHQGAILKSTL